MRIGASITGRQEALDAAEGQVAAAATKTMGRALDDLKGELRAQLLAAGFSERMAKTWQGKVYPGRGNSLNPAAYVWSKAPGIIDAYARGATIVPKAGRRFLAIPTDDVPRKRAGRALTPQEVEDRFGKRLVFIDPKDKGFVTPSVRKAGVAYLVLRNLVIQKSSGRYRNASSREMAGNTRNPRRPAAVVMFVLVPQVKVPKKLDLQGAANAVAASVSQLLAESWSEA